MRFFTSNVFVHYSEIVCANVDRMYLYYICVCFSILFLCVSVCVFISTKNLSLNLFVLFYSQCVLLFKLIGLF